MFDIRLLGNRIKELRKQHGLTQNEFAEALNISFQAVSNWERGVTPPDLENVIRIAEYFGILTDDLLRPKNEDLFLGIDGGATKTEFAAVSADGRVHKRLLKSGCNPNDVGYDKTVAVLTDGIGEILSECHTVKNIFCGIAGISAGDYAKRLYTELKKRYGQIHIQIKSDPFNLFALNPCAELAVISGTGSSVFVKCGENYRRIGGWGYLFSRAGSAYDIGRDAVIEALYEEDMQQTPSLMSEMLRQKLNTATVWEHINTLYREGKPYIANLATVVFHAAREGDKKACGIIDGNAKALADQLNAGIELYGVKPIAVASGGLFENYRDIMTEHVQKYTPVTLSLCELPPIYGACRNACAVTACHLSDEFYENFKKTYGGIQS